MTKKELIRQLTDLTCTIQQIKSGNQVVIDRFSNWGMTMTDLMTERFNLIFEYNRKYGKRFGSISSTL